MNIENKKQMATILLAVGLGLVAAMLMSKVVSDKVDEQTRTIAKEYQGRSAALVKEMEITKATLNKLANDHASLARRVAQQPKVVAALAVSRPTKSPVQKAAFSLRTPPGKRAVTISIHPLAAVGGLVNAGDFVDVIAHLNIPEGVGSRTTTKVTTVLFQNIQVLAVGTNFNPVGNVPPYAMQQGAGALTITFSVTPQEANLLTFVQPHARFQLSLRSPSEGTDKILQQVASWEALADFVLEHQGTELRVPRKRAKITEGETEEVEEAEEEPRPTIQIFRRGMAL